MTQEEINTALDTINDAAEYQSAFELAMKKYASMSRLESEAQIRRIQSLLRRKGFSYQIIAQVIREIGVKSQFDE